MHRTIRFIPLLALLWVLASCRKDPIIKPPVPTPMGTVNINVRPFGGTIPANIGTTLIDATGRRLKLSVFKMLIHDLRLIKVDNTTLQLKDFILLDLASSDKVMHSQGWNLTYAVPAGTYKGISFNVGVPVAVNHATTIDYPDGHPLSLTSGMYWSWGDGYRFMIIEGKIDSSAAMTGTSIDRPFAYHTGLDSMYRSLRFDTPAFNVETSSEREFILEMDIMRFFYTEGVDTLNIVSYPYSHSTPYGSSDYYVGLGITNRMTQSWYKVPF